MTTLFTGELSSSDDDPFRVGRQHTLGKGVTRLVTGEVPISPDRRSDRSAARMAPAFDLVQRAEAYGFIAESVAADVTTPPAVQHNVGQNPPFRPVPLWEVAIGDTKATTAEVKETVTHTLDQAVAGEQLTSKEADALWLELVDGQDVADMEQNDRDAMMKRLYDMYVATAVSTPFVSQPEYTIPFIKYTRATNDRGPKTIPEIKDDLNRLDMGGGKVRRETIVLQIAGVMQTVLETARATKPVPNQ